MDTIIRFNLRALLPALLIMCFAPELNPFPQRETAGSFPLNEGTTWLYRGIVRWYDMETQKTVAARVISRSEVVRVIRRNDLVAAVIKGFPPDLDWSEGQAPRGDWLIVRASTGELYLFGAEEVEQKLERLENPGDSLEKMLTVAGLFMKFASKKGMKLCDAEAKARTAHHADGRGSRRRDFAQAGDGRSCGSPAPAVRTARRRFFSLHGRGGFLPGLRCHEAVHLCPRQAAISCSTLRDGHRRFAGAHRSGLHGPTENWRCFWRGHEIPGAQGFSHCCNYWHRRPGKNAA